MCESVVHTSWKVFDVSDPQIKFNSDIFHYGFKRRHQLSPAGVKGQLVHHQRTNKAEEMKETSSLNDAEPSNEQKLTQNKS